MQWKKRMIQAICKAMLMTALTIPDRSAHAAATRDPVNPPSLVIALDLSGSMRPCFDRIRETVGDLLYVLPDGSRLALVGFDEEAEEIARTAYLTTTQRQMVRDRLGSLRPDGQWTDFEAATSQISRSISALDGVSLLVIFTDAVSDPAPGNEFHELNHLLCGAYVGGDEVEALVLVPDGGKALQAAGCDSVHVAVLGDITPEEILGFVPVERISIPSVRLTDVPVSKILGLATLLGVTVMIFALIRRVIRRRDPEEEEENSEPSSGPVFEMIARHGQTRQNLGPVEEVDQITIGTTADCDVPLPPPEEHDFELVLCQKSGRFKIKNRSDVPVEVNGVDLHPGKSNWLTFPAHLIMGEKLKVFMLQVPKREVVESDHQAVTQSTEEAHHV